MRRDLAVILLALGAVAGGFTLAVASVALVIGLAVLIPFAGAWAVTSIWPTVPYWPTFVGILVLSCIFVGSRG